MGAVTRPPNLSIISEYLPRYIAFFHYHVFLQNNNFLLTILFVLATLAVFRVALSIFTCLTGVTDVHFAEEACTDYFIALIVRLMRNEE